MKALITGMNGTVGTALKAAWEQAGHTAVGWDRNEVAAHAFAEMEPYVAEIAPDVIFHLAVASNSTGLENEGWVVNYEWSGELAWLARVMAIPFVFTSTAMVFSDQAKGPFTQASAPDAQVGYGYEKRRAEEHVWEQNPHARIVRLGWQIGSRLEGGNQMTAALEKQHREQGEIQASTRWLPACSFLSDTAEVLLQLPTYSPGIYMADANTNWNHYQIASALGRHFDRPWRVVPTDDFVFDQRLIDDRISLPPLEHYLSTLS